jgi:uncharacterized membrane protein
MNIIQIQDRLVQIVIALTWTLYFLSFLGVYSKAHVYLQKINFFFKVYICIFLVIRFQPYFPKYSSPITKLDKKLAFLSGVFFLTNVVFEKIKELIEARLPISYKKFKSVEGKAISYINKPMKNIMHEVGQEEGQEEGQEKQ